MHRFTPIATACLSALFFLASAGPAVGQPAGEEEGSLAVATAPLEKVRPALPTLPAPEMRVERVALPQSASAAPTGGAKTGKTTRHSASARQETDASQRAQPRRIPARSQTSDEDLRAGRGRAPAPPAPRAAPRGALRPRPERIEENGQAGRTGGGFAATRQLYPTDAGRLTAVEEAKAQYRRTGRARTVSTGDSKVFPFGRSQPYVKTTALRHTILELANEEYVVNSFIGDDTRWQVETGVTGTQRRFTQVVAVKPLDCGVTTNLSLTTNQGRLYQITLDAAPCDLPEDRNPQAEYVSHVRWWYPEGMGRSPAPPAPARRGAAAFSDRSEGPGGAFGNTSPDSGPAAGLSIPVSEANTAYEVDADRGVPCEPSMVADDGERMYVRFPEGPLCENTYPLYRMSEEGELHLMNYTVLGSKEGAHTYVTENVPVRAAIQYRTGEGDDAKRVVIRNTRLLRKMHRRR